MCAFIEVHSAVACELFAVPQGEENVAPRSFVPAEHLVIRLQLKPMPMFFRLVPMGLVQRLDLIRDVLHLLDGECKFTVLLRLDPLGNIERNQSRYLVCQNHDLCRKFWCKRPTDVAAQQGNQVMIHKPKSGSWTGWSVRFLRCGARRNDAEWRDRAGRSGGLPQ